MGYEFVFKFRLVVKPFGRRLFVRRRDVTSRMADMSYGVNGIRLVLFIFINSAGIVIASSEIQSIRMETTSPGRSNVASEK